MRFFCCSLRLADCTGGRPSAARYRVALWQATGRVVRRHDLHRRTTGRNEWSIAGRDLSGHQRIYRRQVSQKLFDLFEAEQSLTSHRFITGPAHRSVERMRKKMPNAQLPLLLASPCDLFCFWAHLWKSLEA